MPAAASANVELYEGATKLAIGAKIKTQTAGYVKFFNGSGTEVMTCSDANFEGTVAENGPSKLQVDLSGGKLTGWEKENKCVSSFGPASVNFNGPLCWRNSVILGETWRMASGTCGGTEGYAEITVTNGFGKCVYRPKNSDALFMNNISLDPLKLRTSGSEAIEPFKLTSGGLCTAELGMQIWELQVKSAGGTNLKLVH